MSTIEQNGPAASVASILISSSDVLAQNAVQEQRIAALTEQNQKLEMKVQYLTSQLEDAKRHPRQWKGVIERLYEETFDTALPYDADLDKMYDRVHELIEEDSDNEVWNPERDFDVTLTYIVTVTGTIRAKTEDDARLEAKENTPEVYLGDSDTLRDACLSWDLDEVQIG
jgi:hypothetical protein